MVMIRIVRIRVRVRVTFGTENSTCHTSELVIAFNKLRPPQYAHAPVTLTFDLILKVVSESRVTWAASVPILVFLGLSVLELFPMYATDRLQTDVRQKHRLMPPPRGRGHNNAFDLTLKISQSTMWCDANK